MTQSNSQTTMGFVIQYNLLSNDLMFAVKDAVECLPHTFVGLIPFSREITSNEPIEGLNHIPYGSTSFVEAAIALGWKGLSFDVENFSYRTACANRNDMLNGGNILSAKDMVEYLKTRNEEENIFMRPAHDLKQFSGSVYSVKEAADFLIDTMTCASSGSYKIEPDLLIVVAVPRNILIEWRWFVVGGKVIDGSMYRRNGQLTKEHVNEMAGYSQYCQAQEMADKWLPNACCVMDTALLDSGEMKVIEFNCINGSGFYDHNIKKILTAWSRHYNG